VYWTHLGPNGLAFEICGDIRRGNCDQHCLIRSTRTVVSRSEALKADTMMTGQTQVQEVPGHVSADHSKIIWDDDRALALLHVIASVQPVRHKTVCQVSSTSALIAGKRKAYHPIWPCTSRSSTCSIAAGPSSYSVSIRGNVCIPRLVGRNGRSGTVRTTG
jgi:hypothetical protein